MNCRATTPIGVTGWRSERGAVEIWILVVMWTALWSMAFRTLRKTERLFERSFHVFLPANAASDLGPPREISLFSESFLQLPPRFDYGLRPHQEALAICVLRHSGWDHC